MGYWTEVVLEQFALLELEMGLELAWAWGRVEELDLQGELLEQEMGVKAMAAAMGA